MLDLSIKKAVEAFSGGEDTVFRTIAPVSTINSIEWLNCNGYVICKESDFHYLLDQAKEFSNLTD